MDEVARAAMVVAAGLPSGLGALKGSVMVPLSNQPPG